MSRTVLIDYDEMGHDTGLATVFTIGDDEVWIPNSQIEEVWEHDHQVEITEWFAREKELI